MTCHQFEPYIVDLARDRAAPSTQVENHLRTCEECTALLERERVLSAGLRRLALDVKGPLADRETALLVAFDAVWAESRPPARIPRLAVMAGIAATGVMVVVLAWRGGIAPDLPVIAVPPDAPAVLESQTHAVLPLPADTASLPLSTGAPVRRRQPIDRPSLAEPAGEFIAWPSAAAWPPFESGELIRVELTLDGGIVKADVLVGQDGFARAVRLVQ